MSGTMDKFDLTKIKPKKRGAKENLIENGSPNSVRVKQTQAKKKGKGVGRPAKAPEDRLDYKISVGVNKANRQRLEEKRDAENFDVDVPLSQYVSILLKRGGHIK